MTCREMIASLLPTSTREMLSNTAWFRSVYQFLTTDHNEEAGSAFNSFKSLCEHPPLKAPNWNSTTGKQEEPASYRAQSSKYTVEKDYLAAHDRFLTPHNQVLSVLEPAPIHSLAHGGPRSQLTYELWIHAEAVATSTENYRLVPRFAVKDIHKLPRSSGTDFNRAFEALVFSFAARHWPEAAPADFVIALN